MGTKTNFIGLKNSTEQTIAVGGAIPPPLPIVWQPSIPGRISCRAGKACWPLAAHLPWLWPSRHRLCLFSMLAWKASITVPHRNRQMRPKRLPPSSRACRATRFRSRRKAAESSVRERMSSGWYLFGSGAASVKNSFVCIHVHRLQERNDGR